MTREDDQGHVINLGQRIELAWRLVGTELSYHRPDDLPGDDTLRKCELGLSKPGTSRRLHAAVGTEVAGIIRLDMFPGFRVGLPPFELALTGRTLAAKKPIRVERDCHPEGQFVITHGISQASSQRHGGRHCDPGTTQPAI